MDGNTKEVQVQASRDELKGVYSNIMRVSHTGEEFVLDFMNLVGNEGVLAARVILSPGHYKRMIKALEDNLKKFEQKYGEIKTAEEPKREIGFRP
jgi:hypothetical protein